MLHGEQDMQLVFLSAAGQVRLSRSLPFSRSRIFKLAACDSSSAANMPAGPAPTMMTSYFLAIRSPPHKIAQGAPEAQGFGRTCWLRRGSRRGGESKAATSSGRRERWGPQPIVRKAQTVHGLGVALASSLMETNH